jgi:hypothetical protein
MSFRFDMHRYKPPLASDFPTLISTNSINPTLTDAQNTPSRGLVMDFGISPVAGDNVRCALKSKTAGSTQSIIMRCQPTIFNVSASGAGIVLRESGSGKLLTWGFNWDGIRILRWNSAVSFNATSGTNLLSIAGINYEWFKITLVADDPKQFFISRNGTDWILVNDVSQTGFLTFDQVGAFCYINGGVAPSGNKLSNAILYYKDAGIVPTF